MRKKIGRKLRFLLVYPLLVWLMAVAYTTERRMLVGIGLVLLGELLRFWSDGYVGHVKVNLTQKDRGDSKVGRLVTAGPYALVRHPLYLGTFIIGAGFCVIAGNLWVSVAALAFFLIVYRRKMIQEESLIQHELGTPYVVYKAFVPRWLPLFRRYPNRRGKWSWQGILASKEWKTLIWVFVVIIALYLREEFLQEHDFFSTDKWLKHALLLITVFVLMATDGMIELISRRRRAIKTMSVPG